MNEHTGRSFWTQIRRNEVGLTALRIEDTLDSSILRTLDAETFCHLFGIINVVVSVPV